MHEKAPHNFSAKNITATNFVSTVRLNESMTNAFVMLIDALNNRAQIGIWARLFKTNDVVS